MFNNNLYTVEHSKWGSTTHYNFDFLKDDECALVAEKCRNEASNLRFHAKVQQVIMGVSAGALFFTAIAIATMIPSVLWTGSALTVICVPLVLMGLCGLAATVLPDIIKSLFEQLEWYKNTSHYMDEQASIAQALASPVGIEILNAN